MLQYTIEAPERLDTSVGLPASKSISNRALIIHALSGGAVFPDNLSDCDDTAVLVDALERMPEVIDVGAAGTAMRFLTAYLSITPGTHLLTGTERMLHRPIGTLVDALRQLGADISYEGEIGFPPLLVKGHALDGGSIEVAADISSQYISALLLIGPAMRKGLTLRLTGGAISSRPYIDLTLWTMREYGADAEWTDVDTITVKPHMYRQRPYLIENDWSAAGYWYELMALSSDRDARVVLAGLMDGSKQGDSVVRYIFSLLGVRSRFGTSKHGVPTTVTLGKSFAPVPRLEYNFINAPDLAQTVVVACAALGIHFHFTGLGSLKIKETDRIEALKTELRKIGVVVRDHDNCELIWEGGQCEPTWEPIDTYEDHRMAMAFAPLALVHPQVRINNPEVVSKSYPRFWDDLRQAGFRVD